MLLKPVTFSLIRGSCSSNPFLHSPLLSTHAASKKSTSRMTFSYWMLHPSKIMANFQALVIQRGVDAAFKGLLKSAGVDVGNAVVLFNKRIAFGHMLSPDLSGFQMSGGAKPVGAIARELYNGNAVYTSSFTSYFFLSSWVWKRQGCSKKRTFSR